MDCKNLMEKDRRMFERIRKFQLPPAWKRIGFGLVVVALGLMIVRRYVDNLEQYRPFFSHLFLLGLLLVSVSRDKLEDEMISVLRGQSYAVGFVTGVVYALVQPYINYLVAAVIKPENATLDMSVLQVLTFMLVVQLLFFWQLKRWSA